MGFRLSFDSKSFTDGMNAFSKKFKEEHKKALVRVGLQLLNNVVTGKGGSTVRPPIKDGNLRASGSVFVGKVFAGGGDGDTTLKNWDEPNEDSITVVFNVPYARRMHEHTGNWGEASMKDGQVENKFLEKHILNDGESLLRTYTNTLKRGLGT
jgi:hypothetical protein